MQQVTVDGVPVTIGGVFWTLGESTEAIHLVFTRMARDGLFSGMVANRVMDRMER